MHIEARDARWAAARKAEFYRWLSSPWGKPAKSVITAHGYDRTVTPLHIELSAFLPRSKAVPVPDHAPEALPLAAHLFKRVVDSLDDISRTVGSKGGPTAGLDALQAHARGANLVLAYVGIDEAGAAVGSLDTATRQKLWSMLRDAWVPLVSDRRQVRAALCQIKIRTPLPSGATPMPAPPSIAFPWPEGRSIYLNGSSGDIALALLIIGHEAAAVCTCVAMAPGLINDPEQTPEGADEVRRVYPEALKRYSELMNALAQYARAAEEIGLDWKAHVHGSAATVTNLLSENMRSGFAEMIQTVADSLIRLAETRMQAQQNVAN